jgi:hypothetical protein
VIHISRQGEDGILAHVLLDILKEEVELRLSRINIGAREGGETCQKGGECGGWEV